MAGMSTKVHGCRVRGDVGERLPLRIAFADRREVRGVGLGCSKVACPESLRGSRRNRRRVGRFDAKKEYGDRRDACPTVLADGRLECGVPGLGFRGKTTQRAIATRNDPGRSGSIRPNPTESDRKNLARRVRVSPT
jgi:hypothetical protein